MGGQLLFKRGKILEQIKKVGENIPAHEIGGVLADDIYGRIFEYMRSDTEMGFESPCKTDGGQRKNCYNNYYELHTLNVSLEAVITMKKL